MREREREREREPKIGSIIQPNLENETVPKSSRQDKKKSNIKLTHAVEAIATSLAFPASLEKHLDVLTSPDVRILYKMESLPIKISIGKKSCMSFLCYILLYIDTFNEVQLTSQQIIKCVVIISSFKKRGVVMDAQVIHSKCFSELARKAREVAIGGRG